MERHEGGVWRGKEKQVGNGGILLALVRCLYRPALQGREGHEKLSRKKEKREKKKGGNARARELVL
jgi:hypothetical protein